MPNELDYMEDEMPTIYLKMYGPHDQEIMMPYTYGKNGRKKRKPVDLKPKWWEKIADGYIDLFNMLRGK
jgi:hypothetical protein